MYTFLTLGLEAAEMLHLKELSPDHVVMFRPDVPVVPTVVLQIFCRRAQQVVEATVEICETLLLVNICHFG